MTERIIRLTRDYPYLGSPEIAERAGTSSPYVRTVWRRHKLKRARKIVSFQGMDFDADNPGEPVLD